MQKRKSFTLIEILISAILFTTVALMATAIIAGVVNSRNKVIQQKHINSAAQQIFDEIGRTIRVGSPNKQIYICSHDVNGQTANVPDTLPNDFIEEWGLNNAQEEFVRHNLTGFLPDGPPFGEEIGDRRIGNILQIVELNSSEPETDIGWTTGGPNNISKITQYSVEFGIIINNHGLPQGDQAVKMVLDTSSTEFDQNDAEYFPCRNLAVYIPMGWDFIEIHNLLPDKTRLINLENFFGNAGGVNNLMSKYFIFEGCDDLRRDTDGGPGLLMFTPDLDGEPLSCEDGTTYTEQSMYGPLIRVSLGIESGIESAKEVNFTNSVFTTTFQTRRVY